MATPRIATTSRQGSLLEGSGRTTVESSGLGTFDVSWPSRAEEPNGKTTPQELIFQPGQRITEVRLRVRGDVPASTPAASARNAEVAKENCPVSRALAAVPISLTVLDRLGYTPASSGSSVGTRPR